MCYFEWHYGQAHPEFMDYSYEKLIQTKHEFYNSLLTAEQLSKNISHQNNITVKRRHLRRSLSDPSQIWLYFGKEHKHVPQRIEHDLECHLKTLYSQFDGTVICMNCTKRCMAEVHGVHLYIELPTESEADFIEILVMAAQTRVKRLHNLPCTSFMFFTAGAFRQALQCDVKTHHFRLMDTINGGKLDDRIVYTVVPPNEDFVWLEPEECATCRGDIDSHLTPLHWNTFDVVVERSTDVPINIQMLLEAFINTKTVQTTKNLPHFLKHKTVRLYAIYDALLNTNNKHHLGVIQELSTSQLMMNYQSIGFTLNLCHNLGMTSVQSTAEDHWNKRATDDLNYYNYAVRKYPLEYETQAGKNTYLVSLRDCYNIAMRDNLVTITERSNPKPSESRHGQVCTLQGTDIGIPRDSSVISEIHEENDCDGHDNSCQCLEKIALSKKDLKTTLITLTDNEKKQVTKCTQLCHWGLAPIWKQINHGKCHVCIT